MLGSFFFFPVFRINEVLPLNSLKRMSPVRFSFLIFFFLSINVNSDFSKFDVFQTSVLKLAICGQKVGPVLHPLDLIPVVAGVQRCSRLILHISYPRPGISGFPGAPDSS